MHQERPMQLAKSRSKPDAGKVAFNWEDPLGLEAELTPEERMVRDSAHGYCQDKLFPGVIAAYREEKFDRALCRTWARWVFWARRSRRNTAARDWAMSPMD